MLHIQERKRLMTRTCGRVFRHESVHAISANPYQITFKDMDTTRLKRYRERTPVADFQKQYGSVVADCGILARIFIESIHSCGLYAYPECDPKKVKDHLRLDAKKQPSKETIFYNLSWIMSLRDLLFIESVYEQKDKILEYKNKYNVAMTPKTLKRATVFPGMKLDHNLHSSILSSLSSSGRWTFTHRKGEEPHLKEETLKKFAIEVEDNPVDLVF